jgi:predicted metalloprotease
MLGEAKKHSCQDCSGETAMKRQFAFVLVLLSLMTGSAIADETGRDASQKPSVLELGGRTGSDAVRTFVAKILGETEVRWPEILRERGLDYRAPRLVLYSGQTGSACGIVAAGQGPRYCMADERIYLDPSFFEIHGVANCADTKGCELARAIVVAREVGHHVQNLLGISAKATEMMQPGRSDPQAAADIARRSELQADCFAGIWANRANRNGRVIAQDEVEPGLGILTSLYTPLAGSADRFGTDGDRKRWFHAGYAHGQLGDCHDVSSN